MDDILKGISRLSSHCGEDEYDNLIGVIKACSESCENGTYGVVLANKVHFVNQRYIDNITFDINDYKNKVTYVSEENFLFIKEIKKMLDEYFRILAMQPYNYEAQIVHSLEMYEVLRDGLDVGMVIASKK